VEHTKQFVIRHFEPLVVLALVAATAFAVLVAVDKLAFLNFFYLPVLVAAYFLGLRQGTMVAIAAVLMVAIYAVINPVVFAAASDRGPIIALFLWAAFLVITAYLVGSLYEAKARTVRELKHAYDGILGLIATLIDAVDMHEQDHSVRVAGLAARVAVVLELPNEQIEMIHGSGMLHEVSKVDVNLDTLRKAARSEQEARRGHAGAALVSTRGLLGRVVDVVEAHTESFDGTGPKGLAGEQIPLGARVLAVAEEYESRLIGPPFGPGLNSPEALTEVERLSGTRLDPAVVPALIIAVESE
jgi:HD-GYP domain-containing protein (c-di-GMP phosphodiesterase class II)